MSKKNKANKATTIAIKDVKPEKVKKGKVEFKPGTDVKYGVPVPEGFDFSTYKPLKKKNFETEALYFRHRATEMEEKSLSFIAKAQESEKYGSTADRKKAKQLVKLTQKIKELKAKLTDEGINVEELLAAAK